MISRQACCIHVFAICSQHACAVRIRQTFVDPNPKYDNVEDFMGSQDPTYNEENESSRYAMYDQYYGPEFYDSMISMHDGPGTSMPVIKAVGEGEKQQRHLVFIKTKKTGGSTFNGPLRNIAAANGYEGVKDMTWPHKRGVPHVSGHHSMRSKVEHIMATTGIVRESIFYITLFRDPVERCLSQFYMHHKTSHSHMLNMDTRQARQKLVQWLTNCGTHWLATYTDTQVNGSIDDTPTCELKCNPRHDASSIMNSYDFVMVTERFAESLVLLRHQLTSITGLNIRLVDLLHTRAKVAGIKSESPHYKPIAQMPKDIQEAAVRYIRGGADDTLVYLANRKLDKLAKSIGSQFTNDLSTFMQMQAEVDRICGPAERNPSECYIGDWGCHQTCIKELATKHGWA